VSLRRLALLAAALLAAAVQAQDQPAAQQDLRAACAALPSAPATGHALAERARCVLAGALPSADRLAEVRALARKARDQDEPAGGLLLYLAFQADPAWQFVHEGKVDLAAYRRLAALPPIKRRDQVEAIEGLALAASRGNGEAGQLLASYFHDTVAPQNVRRLRVWVDLLARDPLRRNATLARFAREARSIERSAAGTRASARAFFGAYRQAVVAARAGYAAQNPGKACEQVELRSVSAGDIDDAEFLPLGGTLVMNSFLVKGSWPEFWRFQACGDEVPVKLAFRADGWGGASFSAEHNKGS
jgi:hypothetical protein